MHFLFLISKKFCAGLFTCVVVCFGLSADINVRSWRAGIQVVKQELGKLPKMSNSPPTKDSSPEQHLDDSGLALQSNLLAHLESNDVHSRITEKHEDNRIEQMRTKNNFQEKRSGAMEMVNDHVRSDIDDDQNEDKEDISDQSAQARDEIHQDREMDNAQNENDEGNYA